MLVWHFCIVWTQLHPKTQRKRHTTDKDKVRLTRLFRQLSLYFPACLSTVNTVLVCCAFFSVSSRKIAFTLHKNKNCNYACTSLVGLPNWGLWVQHSAEEVSNVAEVNIACPCHLPRNVKPWVSCVEILGYIKEPSGGKNELQVHPAVSLIATVSMQC